MKKTLLSVAFLVLMIGYFPNGYIIADDCPVDCDNGWCCERGKTCCGIVGAKGKCCDGGYYCAKAGLCCPHGWHRRGEECAPPNSNQHTRKKDPACVARAGYDLAACKDGCPEKFGRCLRGCGVDHALVACAISALGSGEAAVAVFPACGIAAGTFCADDCIDVGDSCYINCLGAHRNQVAACPDVED
jgi:hypothetical protein